LCQGDRTTLETCWKSYLGLVGSGVLAECADGVRQGRLLEVTFDGILLDQPDHGPIRLPPETILHLQQP
jgi:hypothetical protein